MLYVVSKYNFIQIDIWIRLHWHDAESCFADVIWTICGCRYIATIDGAVNKRHLVAISEGTVVDGIHCTPDAVELLPQQPDISRVRIRIVVN